MVEEALKLPAKVVNPDWEQWQLIGGDEEGEINASLVKKSEVKDATTSYKNRKIGRVAIFSAGDKLVA